MFKLRPAVGTVHAPLDAIEELRRRHSFSTEEIEAIDVGIAPYALAHGATIVRPTDMIGAQFSLAFSIGLLLVTGKTRLLDYADHTMWTAPEILRIADKVKARGVTFEANAPHHGAVVTIKLRDRRILEYYQRAFRGHPTNPVGDDDIRVKFIDNVAGVLSNDEAKRTIELVQQLDRLRTVSQLLRPSVRADAHGKIAQD
jgi:2-methylcitrate dehydratase PrpD